MKDIINEDNSSISDLIQYIDSKIITLRKENKFSKNSLNSLSNLYNNENNKFLEISNKTKR